MKSPREFKSIEKFTHTYLPSFILSSAVEAWGPTSTCCHAYFSAYFSLIHFLTYSQTHMKQIIHSWNSFPMELKKKVMKQGRGRNEHRNMRALIKHRESRRAMFVIVETRFCSSRPNLQTNWNRYLGRNTFSGWGMNAYGHNCPKIGPTSLRRRVSFYSRMRNAGVSFFLAG